MRTIRWNSLAKTDYYKNIDYLLVKWNEKVAQNFIDLVYEAEMVLKKGNVEFRATNFEGIRCYVVCKQITLFYKIIDDHNIEFLRFWNNNKDLEKLNF